MRIFYIALFCLPFLFSCEMKKDLLGGGKDSEEGKPTYENVGLLDLNLKAEKEPDAPGTKGTDGASSESLNIDEFAVAILDSTGQSVKEYESFAAMKDDGELLLPVGTYSIKASYGNDQNAGFNAPYYAADTTCSVSEKEVVQVVAECRLENKKVQFICTDDFLSQFTDSYYIVLDNGVGVLTLTKEESRIAYLKNTGTLRITLYATTHDNVAHTYSHDLSKEDLVQSHNNVLIALGTVPSKPDTPGGGDGNNPSDPDEPEMPDDPDPDDPDNPDTPETPEIPVKGPVLKVDVSLIEKDYIIEIPSNFVDSDKPDTPGGDDNTGGGDGKPGGDDKPAADTPTITGTIDGAVFDVAKAQDVTKAKNVVVYMSLPTGLSELSATITIGTDAPFTLNLLDYKGHALETVLDSMGLPKKGEKGKLKFNISPFLGMLGSNNSFKVTVKDNNGKSVTETIKLTKK